MNFVAIYVNADGKIICNEKTGNVLNISLGEMESPEAAVQEACSILDCYSLQNGIIWKNSGVGGFLVCSAQVLMTLLAKSYSGMNGADRLKLTA